MKKLSELKNTVLNLVTFYRVSARNLPDDVTIVPHA